MSQVGKAEVKSIDIGSRRPEDTGKRPSALSPLSQPAQAPPISPEKSALSAKPEKARELPSNTAAKNLAALSTKRDNHKSMRSRLRRAFSFGSASELKRVGATKADERKAKQRQEERKGTREADQEELAQKQRAAGIGESIYTGQGGVFSASTDNLSITSTASSASMLLRKMGQGMRKGSRSIKGLMRPKSVIGVPAADGFDSDTRSLGGASMLTLDAEAERVNVNPSVIEAPGGGTGFPRLERSSLDAARLPASSETNGRVSEGGSTSSRKSIVGSERERAEVLAAVKKGILKRMCWPPSHSTPGTELFPGADTNSGSSSPTVAEMATARMAHTTSPPPGLAVSHDSGSRRQSGSGHKRTDSITLEGEDYFLSQPRYPGIKTAISLPNTPRGVIRNISFSPTVKYHDVWSSHEYDRRGEVATCNRLTPMLAQQIKEELNTYKMVSRILPPGRSRSRALVPGLTSNEQEMEVHELSKPFTHFF